MWRSKVLNGSHWSRAQRFSSEVQGGSVGVQLAGSRSKSKALWISGSTLFKNHIHLLLLQLIPEGLTLLGLVKNFFPLPTQISPIEFWEIEPAKPCHFASDALVPASASSSLYRGPSCSLICSLLLPSWPSPGTLTDPIPFAQSSWYSLDVWSSWVQITFPGPQSPWVSLFPALAQEGLPCTASLHWILWF